MYDTNLADVHIYTTHSITVTLYLLWKVYILVNDIYSLKAYNFHNSQFNGKDLGFLCGPDPLAIIYLRGLGTTM